MKLAQLFAAGLLAATYVSGAPIVDAPGDFLSVYTGPQNGDLDVLTSDVRYDGTNFVFDVTVNGLLGTTPGAVYVWGINRGSATGEAFPGVIDNVRFDWVLGVQLGAFALVADLTNPAAPPVPVNTVVAVGDRLTVTVAASLVPSTGFAPSDYLVSFWPRSAFTDISNTAEISDFAPQSGMAQVSTVPEPGSAALVLAGVAMAVWKMRRSR